jgi:hypothetical protein
LTQDIEEIKPVGSSISLTQELYDLHIFSIREQFVLADKQMELAILDQPAKVREGGELVLQVVGHMQEELVAKMKPELVRLIRKFTGADRVLVGIELKEDSGSDKPMLYTNTDKLNFLREKHPALKEFQRKFGLEVDF